MADISNLFVFNNNKAGMEGIDKAKVNKIIYEASKDSKYYLHTKKQDEKVAQRLSELKLKLDKLKQVEREKWTKVADKYLMDMEVERDIRSLHIVVDMDMFYAQVAMRDNPKFRNVPIAVGGMSMISTTNYVARKFGVRAAMPGFIGKMLCPALVFVPHEGEKYRQAAASTRGIFAKYDPNFRSMSLDEGYLDVTAYVEDNLDKYATGDIQDEQELRLHVASQVAKEIRDLIWKETQLTASAGIACNSMLAKICSDINKPNGQYTLDNNRSKVIDFVENLNVRQFNGIGKTTEKLLTGLGIKTGRDILEQRHILYYLFSQGTAQWLLQISRGIHVRQHTSDKARKSISKERTFTPTSLPAELLRICQKIARGIAAELQSKNLRTSTISIKLKSSDFSVTSRSITVREPVYLAKDINKYASQLIVAEFPLSLRLMGIRLSSLSSADDDCGERQLSLSQCERAMQEKNKDMPKEQVGTCPVCGIELNTTHNWSLNRHIDNCVGTTSPPQQKKQCTSKTIQSYFTKVN